MSLGKFAARWAALVALGLTLGGQSLPAAAVQLTNVTVNGVPYTAGMAAPAADVLTLSGNLITETIDDFYRWYLPNGGLNDPYPGFGFFAVGSDPCIVTSPLGISYTANRPDTQLYWPTPSRCIPNFSIAGILDTSQTNLHGYTMNLKFDTKTGAFAGIQLPVAGVSSGSFVVTLQLNHWSWPAYGTHIDGVADPVWPNNTSLARLEWNTTQWQYFRPQVTLSFNPFAGSQKGPQATGVISGSDNTSRTLLASLITDPAVQSSSGIIWVVADIPGVGLMFEQSDGTWKSASGSDDSAYAGVAYATGTLTPRSFTVFDHLDISGVVGAKVYVGYGSSWSDMLAAKRYQLLYTVQ